MRGRKKEVMKEGNSKVGKGSIGRKWRKGKKGGMDTMKGRKTRDEKGARGKILQLINWVLL